MSAVTVKNNAFSVAPKILEALKVAETYMEKSEIFTGKVRYRCAVFRGDLANLKSHLQKDQIFHRKLFV